MKGQRSDIDQGGEQEAPRDSVILLSPPPTQMLKEPKGCWRGPPVEPT